MVVCRLVLTTHTPTHTTHKNMEKKVIKHLRWYKTPADLHVLRGPPRPVLPYREAGQERDRAAKQAGVCATMTMW